MGGSQLSSGGYGEAPGGGLPTGPGRRRRGRGAVAIPLTGAVALAVLLGVAAKILIDREGAGAGGCSDAGITLKVAAAPSIKPAIAKAVDRFNQDNPGIDGTCVQASAEQADPSRVLGNVAGGDPQTDIWVPDSSLWLNKLPKNKNPVRGTEPTSLAKSPVVLAARKDVASGLKDRTGDKVGWQAMAAAAGAGDPEKAPKVRVRTLDPARSGVGLVAILAGAGVVDKAGGSGQERQQQLVSVLRTIAQKPPGTQEELFAPLTKDASKPPLIVASEQDVWRYNSGGPSRTATAMYPSEGTVMLDFPFLVTTDDARRQQAAELLRKELTGAEAQKTFQQSGFRSKDGEAGTELDDEHGVSAKAPEIMEVPGGKKISRVLQQAARVNLGTRLLSLMDVSGSMLAPVPGTGRTRIEGIAGVALEGLKNYPDNAEIGMWIFSTDLDGEKGQHYKELVPVGPLGSRTKNGTTRRDLIIERTQKVKPDPHGDTALYDSIAAAYSKMTKTYKNDKVNVLLVLSDGDNDNPYGGKSLGQLVRQLQEQYDPRKPVRIIMISFGEDISQGPMQKIAGATDGEAFTAKTIDQVQQIFLKVVGQRLEGTD